MCHRLACKEKLHSSNIKELTFLFNNLPRLLQEFESLLGAYLKQTEDSTQSPAISPFSSVRIVSDGIHKSKRLNGNSS